MRAGTGKEETAPVVSTMRSFLTLDLPRNGGRSREPLRTCSNHFSTWGAAGLALVGDAGALVAEPAGEAVLFRKGTLTERKAASGPAFSPAVAFVGPQFAGP